mmetsp:Transcript_40760/g.79975  ORF Transcript_40760/g.79975 Transcript_40760/m.79975 type:complete len:653 (-) Transcript_40760:1826-3784(-)
MQLYLLVAQLMPNSVDNALLLVESKATMNGILKQFFACVTQYGKTPTEVKKAGFLGRFHKGKDEGKDQNAIVDFTAMYQQYGLTHDTKENKARALSQIKNDIFYNSICFWANTAECLFLGDQSNWRQFETWLKFSCVTCLMHHKWSLDCIAVISCCYIVLCRTLETRVNPSYLTNAVAESFESFLSWMYDFCVFQPEGKGGNWGNLFNKFGLHIDEKGAPMSIGLVVSCLNLSSKLAGMNSLESEKLKDKFRNWFDRFELLARVLESLSVPHLSKEQLTLHMREVIPLCQKLHKVGAMDTTKIKKMIRKRQVAMEKRSTLLADSVSAETALHDLVDSVAFCRPFLFQVCTLTDSDKDGKLSRQDFVELFARLGVTVSQPLAERMMAVLFFGKNVNNPTIGEVVQVLLETQQRRSSQGFGRPYDSESKESALCCRQQLRSLNMTNTQLLLKISGDVGKPVLTAQDWKRVREAKEKSSAKKIQKSPQQGKSPSTLQNSYFSLSSVHFFPIDSFTQPSNAEMSTSYTSFVSGLHKKGKGPITRGSNVSDEVSNMTPRTAPDGKHALDTGHSKNSLASTNCDSQMLSLAMRESDFGRNSEVKRSGPAPRYTYTLQIQHTYWVCSLTQLKTQTKQSKLYLPTTTRRSVIQMFLHLHR